MAYLNALRKIFIPPDWTGLTLLLVNLGLPFALYDIRLRFAELARTGGMGTGLALMMASPLLCLIGLVILALIVATVGYAFRRDGHPLPTLVMLAAFLLGALYPLPPSPEEVAFKKHRADYARVVEMARQHQLGHDGRCQAAFSLPPAYRHLTDCVWVEDTPTFFVEFLAADSNRAVVYLDEAEMLESIVEACGADGQGSIFKQLDEHWFICAEDPN